MRVCGKEICPLTKLGDILGTCGKDLLHILSSPTPFEVIVVKHNAGTRYVTTIFDALNFFDPPNVIGQSLYELKGRGF